MIGAILFSYLVTFAFIGSQNLLQTPTLKRLPCAAQGLGQALALNMEFRLGKLKSFCAACPLLWYYLTPT